MEDDLQAAWVAESDAWIEFARSQAADPVFWRFNLPSFLDLVPEPGSLTLDVGCGEGRRDGYPARRDDAAWRSAVSVDAGLSRAGVFSVRSAESRDAGRLREIERLAGERFREVGLAEVADDEPPSVRELRRSARDGRCWVAVGASGRPVGYVTVSDVDGHAHVDQMSVHPDNQGMGAGRALIERARVWALETGRDAITLTTYADVPWNQPLYQHLGFRVMDESEIGSELRSIREAERARGLDLRPRVCMRLDLGRRPGALTVS